MKKNIVFILSVLVLTLMVMPASAMINGEPDTDHTNVGAIMMEWPKIPDVDPFIGRLCTATLIHPRALVTAAHCYTYFENQGIGLEQIWVTFDQDPFSDPETYLDVVEFIPHPDFKVGGVSSSDIALVILEEKVVDIEPQELPRKNYLGDLLDTVRGKDKRDLEFIVVGYGTQGETSAPEIQLDAQRLTGTVTFESLLEMEIKSSNVNPLNAHTCFGDSGGPLFYLDTNNVESVEVLLGVASHSGIRWDCMDEPMFHYRLDSPSAQKFIQDNLPPD